MSYHSLCNNGNKQQTQYILNYWLWSFVLLLQDIEKKENVFCIAPLTSSWCSRLLWNLTQSRFTQLWSGCFVETHPCTQLCSPFLRKTNHQKSVPCFFGGEDPNESVFEEGEHFWWCFGCTYFGRIQHQNFWRGTTAGETVNLLWALKGLDTFTHFGERWNYGTIVNKTGFCLSLCAAVEDMFALHRINSYNLPSRSRLRTDEVWLAYHWQRQIRRAPSRCFRQWRIRLQEQKEFILRRVVFPRF